MQNKSASADVTPEEFTKVWMEENSIPNVAKRLGLHVSRVRDIACYYRRLGVRLPKTRTARKSNVDVEALNAIVQEHQRQQELLKDIGKVKTNGQKG